MELDAREDEEGMLRARSWVELFVAMELDHEGDGVPADRVVLAGFSQGAALAVLAGLTHVRRLGGLAVLSGWLPLAKKLNTVRTL